MAADAPEATATPLEALIRHIPHLPVCLQQSALCQLLRASQHSAALVRQHCLGKLTLHFSTYCTDRLRGFVAWLSKHCCLLAALNLELNLSRSNFLATETAIGAALQKAAASAAATCRNGACGAGIWCSPPGLQLQSYTSHPAVAGAVLDQLDRCADDWLRIGRSLGRM